MREMENVKMKGADVKQFTHHASESAHLKN